MINRLGMGCVVISIGLQGLKPFGGCCVCVAVETATYKAVQTNKAAQIEQSSTDSSPLQNRWIFDVVVYDCELVRACRESCVGLLAAEY
jgi:hypothetical protein